MFSYRLRDTTILCVHLTFVGHSLTFVLERNHVFIVVLAENDLIDVPAMIIADVLIIPQ